MLGGCLRLRQSAGRMRQLASVVWFCAGALVALAAVSLLFLGSSPNPRSHPALRERNSMSLAVVTAVKRALKRPRVVASFTTFPIGTRMAGVGKMLSSLSNQSWKLDGVVMNLPDKIERLSPDVLPIPPEVREWERAYGSWLTVHQMKDYGPATKLLGTLQLEKDPDTIIIVLDDDTYYHYDMVAALVSTMLSTPDDIAPAFKCEDVFKDFWGKMKWRYNKVEGRCSGFAEGFAAYAVRPRYFDQRVFELSSGPKGCRLHDDVWISGSMLVASGVRPHLVTPGFDSIFGSAVNDIGARQQESVFVANKKALEKGESPQRDCVEHFPFVA
mmetsp:Transcript_23719/g.55303  ORF Transcript_23719/g.55303 Transcript_23719/m.55303 type:complete len:329 (+) Transcript_23719:45-1031(+)